MRNLLKEKGYKATPARLAILDIFAKNEVPLDAEAVYKKLSKLKNCKSINEATVYRTLSAFAEEGILARVDLRKDSIHFEMPFGHHHHIVCTNCNAVEDFDNSEIETIIGRIVASSSEFKNITEHSLELFGLCTKCLPVR